MTIKDLEKLKSEGKIRGYSGGSKLNCQKKGSKYGNKKVMLDGILFDSVKESKRYLDLRYLKNVGAITDLRLQVEFELNDGGTHSLKYIADFVYLMNGERIVEDVKGFRTREYKKKRKLMKSIYGIEIKEV